MAMGEPKMGHHGFGAGLMAALFGMLALVMVPARAETPDPAVQQVQGFYDTLLDSMKHAKELGVKGRYAKLRPAVEKAFDASGMLAVIVGGGKWDAIPAGERQALVAAFEKMTAAQYASSFDGFGGEKFMVKSEPKPRGADKVVITKLVAGAKVVPMYYIMRDVGGTWKISNILLNGFIDQLAQQQSEYAATLAKGGAPALTKSLNEKAAEFLKGD
jgi:phospholipid transport system substrate-binding protein